MIDFTNKAIIKLKQVDKKEGEAVVNELLVENEKVDFAFSSIRDKLVLTNKRIISVNVQGITGKKVDFSSIPYSNIQAFSIESAGTLDLDAELDITISGLGTIRFELAANTNIKEIGKYIANFII